ncbi:MAG: arsenate reductase family protein [Pseudomonadota bacterium]
MSVVIHHNPDCGTSRNVLAFLRAAGTDPIVIEYLQTGWTRPQLLALFAAADLTPRSALRVNRSPAERLGLTADGTSDDVLLEHMMIHPILVNRPIVCTRKGVRLCRPSDAVFSLLDGPLPGPIYKEDGQMVVDPAGQVVEIER